MIKSIHISGFQSHKDTTLDLHSGVNAIVGQSDSGKTAILRALNWVLTNRPAGDAFRSSWGGSTAVTIESETTVIERVKSDKYNMYGMGMAPLIDQEFKAMGQGVPQPVLTALNMNSVNIQGQMDAPFLLSSSAGEVAQVLNEVVGLEDIDRALVNINRMARQTAQDLDRARNDESLGLQSLEAFANLDELDTILSAVEIAQAEASRIRTREAELNRLIITIEEIIQVEAKVRSVANLNSDLIKLLAKDADGDLLHDKVNALHLAIKSIENMQESVADGKNLIFNTQQKFKTQFPKECPLCGQEVRK